MKILTDAPMLGIGFLDQRLHFRTNARVFFSGLHPAPIRTSWQAVQPRVSFEVPQVCE